MSKNTSLAIFENFKIRRIYDEKSEKWYFSVVDVVAALTEQFNHQKARNYVTTHHMSLLRHPVNRD